MYITENGMSEAGFDILPRFTTWTYCKQKKGDTSITFQLRARHKTAEHLRKNKPKALNKSLTSRLDKKGRQRLPRMTERNKASARLFKREKNKR